MTASPGWFTKQRDAIKGVSEETTTGVHRLYDLHKKGQLPFPAINVNDSVTKSKFDNKYGCKESLVDGIRRATDTMMAGKVAVVCGYGDVGKGSAASLRGAGARVKVTEVDPICALQAAMDGFEVTLLEDEVATADIFITTTGNKDVIRIEHMRAMKDMAIVGNIGHFDNEIQVAALAQPQMDEHQGTGRHDRDAVGQPHHPSVRRPPAEPWQCHGPSVLRDVGQLHQSGSGADRTLDQGHGLRPGVYILPKHLDEKVARLHLKKIGVKLTQLAPDQAAYIGGLAGRPVQVGTLPLLTLRIACGDMRLWRHARAFCALSPSQGFQQRSRCPSLCGISEAGDTRMVEQAEPSRRELVRDRLLRNLPKGGRAAEIGVWEGKFSQRILATCAPDELHLIDPWLYMPEFSNTGFGRKKNEHLMDEKHRLVVETFRDNPAVRIHRATSQEALSALPDGYLDWVYIDGNHNEPFVGQDIALCLRKVKPERHDRRR